MSRQSTGIERMRNLIEDECHGFIFQEVSPSGHETAKFEEPGVAGFAIHFDNGETYYVRVTES